MKKVISFSLWGKDPKYTIGAIRNSYLAKYIYTGWETWFYVADCVPVDITEKIIQNGGKIINKGPASYKSMFWRFDPIKDKSVDVFISRDTDSRLNYRERAAVNEWLMSDKLLHIMRDHPYHRTQILGGMWGLRKTIENLDEIIDNFINNNFEVSKLEIGKYDLDQSFLRSFIYPYFENSKIVHDEFFNGIDFPVKRDGREFVGDVFDENDIRHPEFYKLINTRNCT